MSSIHPVSFQSAAPQVQGKRNRDDGLHTLRSNKRYASSADTSVRHLRSGKTYVTSRPLPALPATPPNRSAQEGKWAFMPAELVLAIAKDENSASYDAMRRTCVAWHQILSDKHSVTQHLASMLPPNIAAQGWLGLRVLNAQARGERGFAQGLGSVSTLGSSGFSVAGRTRDHVLYANRRGFELWQVGRNIGPLRRWQHTERWHKKAALSQSGQRVIMGPDLGNVHFFDLTGGGTPRMLWQPSYYVDHVAMQPQGDIGAWVSGSGWGQVKLWDFTTNTVQTLNVQGHMGKLAFSPDGNRLVASGESNFYVWDLPETTPRTVAGVGSISDLTFSPNCRWVAARDESWKVNLFDLNDLTLPSQTFSEFKTPQRAPKFSRDGSMFAFCAGPEIVIITHFGTDKQRTQRIVTGEWGNPCVVDFAPGGSERLIAGNERLRTFQQLPNGDFELMPTTDSLRNFRYWMPPVFSSDGRYVTAQSPLSYGDRPHSELTKQFQFRG